MRMLCSLLDGRKIYLQLATLIEEQSDLEFAALFVQTLNLILLTAPELSPLRKTLQLCGGDVLQTNPLPAATKASSMPETVDVSAALDTSRGIDTFRALFKCWCHNPVATFSLCLLSQAYELSARLVEQFGQADITVGLLMQVDKLVQLIESPIFVHLRLQLLRSDHERHPYLLRSLYGLLMILPQSQAYKTLSERLTTVSSLQLHLNHAMARSNSNHKIGNNNNDLPKDSYLHFSEEDITRMLQWFVAKQNSHSELRLAALAQMRLQSKSMSSSAPVVMQAPVAPPEPEPLPEEFVVPTPMF